MQGGALWLYHHTCHIFHLPLTFACPVAVLITCMLRIWDNIWIYVTTQAQTKMAARQAEREKRSGKAVEREGQRRFPGAQPKMEREGNRVLEENSNENWCGLVFKIMSCRDITCVHPSSRGPHSVCFAAFIFSHLIFYSFVSLYFSAILIPSQRFFLSENVS